MQVGPNLLFRLEISTFHSFDFSLGKRYIIHKLVHLPIQNDYVCNIGLNIFIAFVSDALFYE